MPDINIYKQLFASPVLSKEYKQGDHPEALAALPDYSLDFLLDLCKELSIKSIFEFGSGRSTKAFLNAGYSVASLEDSDYWMNETIKTLNTEEKLRHTSLVRPLQTKFVGLMPVKDCLLDDELVKALKGADLILIDSPYYTPFRESPLWSSISLKSGAVIILDDTRIPTLANFCNRLAASNKALYHKRVNVGHGFDLFCCNSENSATLKLNHSVTDLAKGWLRYFKGVSFYKGLKKPE